jgi:hypothetical protein
LYYSQVGVNLKPNLNLNPTLCSPQLFIGFEYLGTMSPAYGLAPGMSGGLGGHMAPLQQLQAHLLRSGPLAGSLPGSPFLHPSGLYNSPFSTHQSLYMPSLHHSMNMNKQEVRVSTKLFKIKQKTTRNILEAYRELIFLRVNQPPKLHLEWEP